MLESSRSSGVNSIMHLPEGESANHFAGMSWKVRQLRVDILTSVHGLWELLDSGISMSASERQTTRECITNLASTLDYLENIQTELLSVPGVWDLRSQSIYAPEKWEERGMRRRLSERSFRDAFS